MQFTEVKIEVFIPEEYVVLLRDELNKVGACRTGHYDNCLSYSSVKGYWRPLAEATPFNGKIDQICEGQECKVEIKCKRELVKDALEVINEIHPYETPMIYIIPILNAYFNQV
ncbi:divalent cation tolerance protein CutA [Bacillus paramycoides]|uniref:divalent cation tolerance protein CutA n=1 Tax=Bacillus paramycoides TaxID=2026194 RepID=UPI0015B799E0|nr:divalent cation tolerance protein CutA [Bacillus paramycoides]NWK69656.1 divalent cation tolerance protein CutA [Bacillus paramycoides]